MLTTLSMLIIAQAGSPAARYFAAQRLFGLLFLILLVLSIVFVVKKIMK